jgi:hypothetical protein
LLGDRFVKPLALDRLCALIAPAIDQAGSGDDAALNRLIAELDTWTATPTGSGIDVPPWLRRLEMEVQNAFAARSTISSLVANQLRLPFRALSPEELRDQLANWDKADSAEPVE